MKERYLKCTICGNIVKTVKESGVKIICCGKPMEELVPGTVEASREKHIPVYSIEDNIVKVNVGSVDYPMEEVHFIEWVEIKTNFGCHKINLHPGEKPHVEFVLKEYEQLEYVLAYCNLHGLWKA